jgi:hypothetical protein
VPVVKISVLAPVSMVILDPAAIDAAVVMDVAPTIVEADRVVVVEDASEPPTSKFPHFTTPDLNATAAMPRFTPTPPARVPVGVGEVLVEGWKPEPIGRKTGVLLADVRAACDFCDDQTVVAESAASLIVAFWAMSAAVGSDFGVRF